MTNTITNSHFTMDPDCHMTRGGDIVFTVGRRYPYGAATVNYTVSGGTAVASTDYDTSVDALTGTLSFADRDLYKTITIHTLAGSGDVTLGCTISSPSGGIVIEAENSSVGYIMDGVIHYFDATLGDDANDGLTPSTAKETWSAVYPGTPGDSYLLKRGETFVTTATRTLGDWGGSDATKTIILGAYGSGNRPIVQKDGEGRVLWFRGSYTTDCGHISVQDLEIMTTSGLGFRPSACVFVGESTRPNLPNNIAFKRVHMHDLQSGFILQPDGVLGGMKAVYNEIIDNTSIGEAAHSAGLGGGAEDFLVAYNDISGNGEIGSIHDWNVYVSHGYDCTVEYNHISGGAQGLKARSIHGCALRGNEIYGYAILGLSIGGEPSTQATDYLVESNWVRGTSGNCISVKDQTGDGTVPAGEGLDGFIVRNNLCELLSGVTYNSAILSDHISQKNGQIHNNTVVVTTDGEGFRMGRTQENVSFYNNICIALFSNGNKALLRIDSAATMAELALDNNIYLTNGGDFADVANVDYSDFSSFKAAYPTHDLNSIIADPLLDVLTDGIAGLDNTSPALYKGRSISGFTTDNRGNPVTNPPTIGASLLFIESFKITGSTLEAGSDYEGASYVAGDEVDIRTTGTDSASPTPRVRAKTETVTIT